MNPESNQDKSWDLQSSWIISPGQAKSILQKSGSVFLDSRGLLRRIQVHIPNSITVQWEDFSESSLPLKGHLLPKEKIASLLNKLNLKEESWIVVVGAGSDGWGEEGRIVWSLREMGYRKSYWINGGDTAFMKDSTKGIIPIAEIQNKDEYSFSISKESIQRSLNSEKFILIDTREEREYKGATPYGESRGGHIPGSKWIYFKDFINKDSTIKSKIEIDDLLKKNNINKNYLIVPYCTGGVRSAIVTGILISYGYQAKNYAGSMWEWSSANEKDYPLIKSNP